jgi:polar amino acid transport system substrate-binding protein
MKANPAVKPITADTDTGCLVLFQQGKAYGISGDDTVLAGDAAQDPYARVITKERFSEEPYGLGINKENVDFVRFVNGVLAQMKTPPAPGGVSPWMASYNTWLGDDLGKLTAPPTAAYGR